MQFYFRVGSDNSVPAVNSLPSSNGFLLDHKNGNGHQAETERGVNFCEYENSIYLGLRLKQFLSFKR